MQIKQENIIKFLTAKALDLPDGLEHGMVVNKGEHRSSPCTCFRAVMAEVITVSPEGTILLVEESRGVVSHEKSIGIMAADESIVPAEETIVLPEDSIALQTSIVPPEERNLPDEESILPTDASTVQRGTSIGLNEASIVLGEESIVCVADSVMMAEASIMNTS